MAGMIVTIDGPAGAGKSSAARALANRLGFDFLDTGAMYRAVALAGLRSGAGAGNEKKWQAIVDSVGIELEGDTVRLDGENVSEKIRTSAVTAHVRHAADSATVRRRLSELQRQWAGERDVVTEGRDQGTEVFPHADCKLFLTASPDERAKRRAAELAERGEPAEIEAVRAMQDRRDREDETRPLGALRPAADAVIVVTDGLSPEEVLDRLAAIVAAKSK